MIGGIGMMGAMAAYLFGKTAPKTVEEWQSEAEKWQRQASMAQTATLDVSMCLSETRRALADEQESARLAKLREDVWIKRATEAERKVKDLEVQIAAAQAPPTVGDPAEGG